jgi:hypothetical protein
MQGIDRLGWAAGVTFDSFGLRLGVRVNDATVLPRIVSRFPPGWKPAPSPYPREIFSLFVGGPGTRPGVRRFHLAYQGPTRVSRTHDLDEAIEALESDLRLYVALWARRRIFVHAGVVAWRGQAIVLPGPSYSGKSTLVAALVRAGARYYSDEYAVLDARGRVHPYPAPLRTRVPGQKQAVAVDSGTDSAPAAVAGKPLPVGLVALCRYQAGARWRPQSLSRGQGVLALLANTVPARFRPGDSMAAIERALSNARALRGVRGQADQMAGQLLDALEAGGSARRQEGVAA